MATLKVEPGPPGLLWVTLPYSPAGIARIKRLPGHRWNLERKQWLLPDTPETRAALAEIVVLPSEAPAKQIAVAPKSGAPPRKPRAPFVPGKPLTLNPPHPLIKTMDDELVLRGMAASAARERVTGSTCATTSTG